MLGLPHEELGEQVAAVVTLQPGAVVDAEDLRRHVADRLAGFRVPSLVLTGPGPAAPAPPPARC